jgi:hypothetical protein
MLLRDNPIKIVLMMVKAAPNLVASSNAES